MITDNMSYYTILSIVESSLACGKIDITNLLLKFIKAKHPDIIKDDDFSCTILRLSLSEGYMDMFRLLQEYVYVLEGTGGLHTKLRYGFRC